MLQSSGGAFGFLPAADEARRRERWLGCLPFGVGGGDGDERVDDVLKDDEGGKGVAWRDRGRLTFECFVHRSLVTELLLTPTISSHPISSHVPRTSPASQD